ncbi:MAG: alanine racemase, partial [Thermodesulfovibrionales bacterium]|nr:alanine racemase [Thermodesulfovibrionales bacterium]
MKRGAVAEIDLSAISQNIKSIAKLVPSSTIIPVIKADAYGHGSVEVAKRLVEEKITFLSVAFSEEAKELRESGINLPIIVFFDPDPDDVIKYNLIPVISDKRSAIELSKA